MWPFKKKEKKSEKQAVDDSQEEQQAAKKEAKQESSNAFSEFTVFLGKKAALQWQVDYDIVSNAQGTQFQSTMIQYFKGADKIRSDTKTQGVESRTYLLNGELTSCTQTSGSWNCFKIEKQKDNVEDVENGLESNPANYEVTTDGTKVIAGVTTKCFKVLEKSQGATIRYCFSGEAIPLYISFVSSQASTEMTAKSFSKSVSDSVFDIPAASTTSIPSAGEAASDPCAACAYLSGEMKDSCLASCQT